jgi:hypothetical protein
MSELARLGEQSIAPAPVAESALVSEEQYERAKKHFELMRRFISEQLTPGEDYGYMVVTDKRTGEKKVISDKPILFKSGAEKLLALLGLTPVWDIKEVEDWDKPFFLYKVKCTLVSRSSGKAVAEGHGIASSKEKKYQSDRVDPYDLPNTLLKMAKKRALVDAILQAGAGFFFVWEQEAEDEELPHELIKKFWATVRNLGFSEEEVRTVLEREYGITSTKQIPPARFQEILGRFAELSLERQPKQQKKLMEGQK